jgi:hypothetical protein
MFVFAGRLVSDDCTDACEHEFNFQRHLEAQRQRAFHWPTGIDPSASKPLLEGMDETIAWEQWRI